MSAHTPPQVLSTTSILALCIAIVFASGVSFARAEEGPSLLNYQGRLLDANGNVLGGSGTEYCFRFSLYADAHVGAPDTRLWPVATPGEMTIPVKEGVFNAIIGDVVAGGDVLDYDFTTSSEVFVNVDVAEQVGGVCGGGDEVYETLGPRQQMTATGFAKQAQRVVGVTHSAIGLDAPTADASLTVAPTSESTVGLSIKSFFAQVADFLRITDKDNSVVFVVDESGDVGIGEADPDARLDIRGDTQTQFIQLADTTTNDSVGIYTGAGSPDGLITAQAGSLYLDQNGKLFVNSDGATAWEESGSGSSGDEDDLVVFDAYDAVGGQGLGSVTTVNIDTIRYSDAPFNLHNDVLTVEESGLYRLIFSGSTDKTNGSRSTARWWIETRISGGSFTEVYGSSCWTFARNQSDGENTCTREVVLVLDPDAEVRLRAETEDNNNSTVTRAEGSSLTVQKLVGAGAGEGTGGWGDNSLWEKGNNGVVYYSDGNVGIGADTSPEDLLNVHANGEHAAIAITSVGSNANPSLKFQLNEDTTEFSVGVDDSDSDSFKISGSDALGTSDFLTLTQTGRLGLGVTNPGAFRLYVRGHAYTTGGWWYGSDERWKENIETLDGALAKVGKLRGVLYDWNTTQYPEHDFPVGRQLGLVAQEVEQVLPELVKTDDEGYKSVAYQNVTALNLQALHELGTVFNLEHASTTQQALTLDVMGNFRVGTSTASTTHKFTVDGNVAALGFVNLSTTESKHEIEHLEEEAEDEILDKVSAIHAATYKYLTDPATTTQRFGLLAEEAPQEVLSGDGKGIDLYKFVTFIAVSVKRLAQKVFDMGERLAIIEQMLGITAEIAEAGRDAESYASPSVSVDEICVDGTCLSGNDVRAMLAYIAGGDVKESVDVEAPEIALRGNASVTLERGSTYSDLGVVVSDNTGRDPVVTVFVNDKEVDTVDIDTAENGAYRIEYVAKDRSGLTASVTRAVHIGESADTVIDTLDEKDIDDNKDPVQIAEKEVPLEMSIRESDGAGSEEEIQEALVVDTVASELQAEQISKDKEPLVEVLEETVEDEELSE